MGTHSTDTKRSGYATESGPEIKDERSKKWHVEELRYGTIKMSQILQLITAASVFVRVQTV